jgi:hypothetical protein
MSRQFRDVGPLRILINLPRVFDLIKRLDDEDSRKALAVIGAESWGSAIGHVRFAGDGFESLSELVFLMRGDRAGLAGLLSRENKPTNQTVGSDAENVFYGSLSIDPPVLLDEVERLVRRVDPESADEMQRTLREFPTPTGETMNLRQEVIDHLRGPSTFSLTFTTPYGVDSARVLVGLGQSSPTAMQKVMSMLPMMTAREYQGSMIYDSPMGGISVGAGSDRVIAGTTAAVERALLPSSGERLADTPAFRRALRFVPESSWVTVFMDEKKLMEAAFGLAEHREALQMAMFSNFTAGIAYGMVESYAGTIDPQKQQALRQLTKYHSATLATIDTTPDGLRFTQVEVSAEP